MSSLLSPMPLYGTRRPRTTHLLAMKLGDGLQRWLVEFHTNQDDGKKAGTLSLMFVVLNEFMPQAELFAKFEEKELSLNL